MSALTVIAVVALSDSTARADDGGNDISAIALQLPTGEYLSAPEVDGPNARLFADQWAIGPTETFYLEEVDSPVRAPADCLVNGVRVRLFTSDGRHWVIRGTEVLVQTSAPDDSRSVFTLINETAPDRCFQYGDRLWLVSTDELYLSASPGGVVDADQERPGDWEIFVLADPSS